jgi:hypothetical protein
VNTCGIYVHAQLVLVRENLWQFLFHMDNWHEDYYLWIDALSIDQENTAEKNHRVQLMWEIHAWVSVYLHFSYVLSIIIV